MRAVILAGGSGTRLWPLSRQAFPKQFLALTGERSLLQETVERVRPLVGENLCVVATRDVAHLVARQLRDLGIDPGGRMILEPVGRNTAPAVGLAALATPADEVLLVLPSDHAIRDAAAFREALARGAEVAAAGYLVTFGITPDRPETGYGYIQAGEPLEGFEGFRKVARFVEKPDRATAERYLAEGGYSWNSGMFAFRAGTILEELDRHAPHVAAGVRGLADAVRSGGEIPEAAYAAIPKISIDYAVMERSDRVAVLPVDPGWSDLGSFAALHEISEHDAGRNAVRVGGTAILEDSTGNLVWAGDKVVALVGVEDAVVVDTPDALLVCRRDRSQDVRKVAEELVRRGRDEAVFHRTVHRPWGTFTTLEEGPGFKVKRIAVYPGERLSLQLHRHRAEQWVVVRGTARVTRGDEVLDLGVGQTVHIPREERHRLENPGTELLEIIEVQTGDYLGEDDIVRLQDDYGRTQG
ncbi:mannose-1-phosphate guanylyltransferase/mannose-6-phosphate isomerase [Deferrisoma sp.]